MFHFGLLFLVTQIFWVIGVHISITKHKKIQALIFWKENLHVVVIAWNHIDFSLTNSNYLVESANSPGTIAFSPSHRF